MEATTSKTDIFSGILLHPLFAGEVSIVTPPIKQMYGSVKRVIALRELGCTFSGPSGAGKTYSISVIGAMLRAELPRLCILTYTAGNQQLPSIRAFYKGFLHAVGHHELRGETWDLRARLVRSMASDARQAGMNIVVLFVDEANALTLQDFLFLKDVYNDLEKEHIQLISILMGQSPDLDAVLDNLAKEGRLDLISRFAMRRLHVPAYSTVAEIDLIFDHIDLIESGGVYWTQFFLPKSFAGGFRLRDQAASAFSAICRADPLANAAGKVAFPARQFFLMLRSFLLDAAADDPDGLADFDQRWDAAVREAKLQDAMKLISTQRKRGK